jgi:hypothetical protein
MMVATLCSPFRQQGQSLLETLLALPFALFLIFATLEFALIYRAKMTLNHAAEMTVRKGALNHGCKAPMYEQMAVSMIPLLMKGERTSKKYLMVDGFKKPYIEIYTHIEILHPTSEVFDAFAEKTTLTPAQISPCAQQGSGTHLQSYGLNRVIPNDNLSFRPSTPIHIAGNTHGDLNIQDANLLKIRIKYCHKLTVPFLDHLIVAVQHWTLNQDKRVFMDYCIRGGGAIGPPVVDEKLILLSTQATARMQTPFIKSSLETNN